MKKRGTSLVEMLIGLILMAVVLYAGAQLITAGYTVHDRSNDATTSYKGARLTLDTVADHIRNSQLNTNNTYVVDSSLHAAAPTTVTYYTNTAGDQVTYRLNGTNLERVADGNTTIVARNITGLNFEYFRLGTYNAAWTAIAGTTATATELPTIGLMRINATISVNGATGRYTTTVRLRNSPRKIRLSGG